MSVDAFLIAIETDKLLLFRSVAILLAFSSEIYSIVNGFRLNKKVCNEGRRVIKRSRNIARMMAIIFIVVAIFLR